MNFASVLAYKIVNYMAVATLVFALATFVVALIW
jgi:hypothetical protein